MSKQGCLFVVATPIGNLEDLSPRAIETLRRADAIFCEDTRVTGKLAARFGLSGRRVSCHAHNENTRIPEVLERLGRGEEVALVSDAGTPALSDPGERIVAAAAEAGFPVVAIPGPSATAAALSISGIPAVPHLFLGFPPPKGGPRREFFERYRTRPETLVYFEAPHRLSASLADAATVFGPRSAILARELTKLHEETLRGTVSELHDRIAGRGSIRGECVIVVSGAPAEGLPPTIDVDAEISRREGRGLPARQIAREVARATGLSSRQIYGRILRRKESSDAS